MASSSISLSSSSSSEDSSSNNELNSIHMNSHLSDHRPLHSSTSTTVCQFSFNILGFCRISHLSDKRRTRLLDLFQKCLPSPDLVTKSGDDLLGAIGIRNFYQSEEICSVCYHSSRRGICSPIGCNVQLMQNLLEFFISCTLHPL